jgi:DNA helicase-2/ATP-dependent DNA helicase PcrA
MRAGSDNEEGNIVASSIFDLRMQHQLPNKDIAILYRTNAQSRAMEEALRKRGIPYRIYGGLSFYKRKEIKDLLAYFRLAINSADEEALRRVINYPARGIGKTTLEKLVVAADQNNVSIFDIIENLDQFRTVTGATAQKIGEFVMMIRSFRHGLATSNAYDLAMHIARSSGLLKELHADKTPEGVSKHDNVMELLNGIQEFVDTPPESDDEVAERTLDVFMRDIALLTDADEKDDEDTNKVTMMTIHAAKGLEFKAVFVVGLEENLFPSQLALNSREELEEERRLFYVAITRAERFLTITYATSRYRWGKIDFSEPSRFLEEIDQNLLELPPEPQRGAFMNFEDERLGFGGFTSRQNSPSTFKPREKTETGFATKTTSSSATPGFQPKPKLTSAAQAISKPGFEVDDLSKLSEGMSVEHEKFGKGKVIHVDGRPGEKKATVLFEVAGQKQLLLKFARLKIINA